jgi:hypothetical protein
MFHVLEEVRVLVCFYVALYGPMVLWLGNPLVLPARLLL